MKARRGFTLIEMLAVVVVILILAGMTLQIMGYVNNKMGKARAAQELERIKNALTEYYSVYGCFPPVSGMSREYGDDTPGSPYTPPSPPAGGAGYRDGLVSYLFLDDNKDRWQKYLQGWPNSGVIPKKGESAGDFGMMAWSNLYWTIEDPWGRSYVYETSEPFQSYRVFSHGPNADPNVTADDVGIKWAE